ncbi:MAG: arsenite methyltransferase [Myxococcales bacterium]
MTQRANQDVRAEVREVYGQIARGMKPSCCGTGGCSETAASLALGYSREDLLRVPEGADLGLGCGNPQATAALRPGEVVLDLGAGAGFDCFLAAYQVGPTGSVIGVDMTPEMIAKARHNAERTQLANVEFRLGEIEHLPLADEAVDVVLSNCVINLSPDKASVFREAFRVLKPGGRLAISDVVATAPIPSALAQQLRAATACVSGATELATLEALLVAAGFQEVRIVVNEQSRAFIASWLPGSGAERAIASASIEARKPASNCCVSTCCVDAGNSADEQNGEAPA